MSGQRNVLPRVACLLAGLWAGLLLGLGAIGAPSGFAVTTAEIAGRSAGRMFAVEAHVSLAAAMALLFALCKICKTGSAPTGTATSVFNTEVLLVLGTLFCTIAGYFVLQSMMVAARAGQGSLSFGMLHGLSAAFFSLKTLLVLSLAWRLCAR